MYIKKEPYAYFQPGEIVFFITHESDQPINPRARDPETKRRVYVESGDPQNNEAFDPDDIDKDHDDDDDDENSYDEKIDSLIGWSNEKAKELGLNLTISRAPKREIHFPGTRNEGPQRSENPDSQPDNKRSPQPRPRSAFSLIPADVRLPPEQWHSQTNPEGYVETADLAKLVVGLDDDRKNQPLDKEITLRTVSPNWLSSPGSEWGGGGGPGGIPEPYKDDPGNLHPFVPPNKDDFQAILKGGGNGVTVAILDTTPCLKDLAKAYERYWKVDPKNREEYKGHEKRHPLIESLLKPDGKLEVHPASIDELYRMRAVHLRDHDYEMTDHGLFVAGIIHSIAPEAKLHLYEVLNHQGVGDLISIAQGFWKVFNRFSRRRLVVNASLVLKIPRLNHPVADFDEAFMEKIVQAWQTRKEEWKNEKNEKRLTEKWLSKAGEEWLAHQGEAIEWICDHLYIRNSRVIAAAGNDWRKDENEPRPKSGYPAAFEPVLGVGALPKNAQRDANLRYPVSHYSNRSDEPEVVGVTTLGGEPGEGNGILGVYIGEFPDMKYRLEQYPWWLRPIMWLIFTIKWGNCIRPKNESDWAWWCGTSFATPIVAGFTAAALSDPNKRVTTQAAIEEMYRTNGILPLQTTDDEDGLEGVTQT
jgi:hypothetical protein